MNTFDLTNLRASFAALVSARDNATAAKDATTTPGNAFVCDYFLAVLNGAKSEARAALGADNKPASANWRKVAPYASDVENGLSALKSGHCAKAPQDKEGNATAWFDGFDVIGWNTIGALADAIVANNQEARSRLRSILRTAKEAKKNADAAAGAQHEQENAAIGAYLATLRTTDKTNPLAYLDVADVRTSPMVETAALRAMIEEGADILRQQEEQAAAKARAEAEETARAVAYDHVQTDLHTARNAFALAFKAHGSAILAHLPAETLGALAEAITATLTASAEVVEMKPSRRQRKTA